MSLLYEPVNTHCCVWFEKKVLLSIVTYNIIVLYSHEIANDVKSSKVFPTTMRGIRRSDTRARAQTPFFELKATEALAR